jgi:hypothetical protein
VQKSLRALEEAYPLGDFVVKRPVDKFHASIVAGFGFRNGATKLQGNSHGGGAWFLR